MKRYVDVTMRVGISDLTDVVASLSILSTLRKDVPWLEVVSFETVPLEPCGCGGLKRKGALMCDACAGGVTG